MATAETLKKDCVLMSITRRLLEIVEVFPPNLNRRIFEAVASCLVLEAAEQRRKTRPTQCDRQHPVAGCTT
jgi:hypothetical protein